MTICQQRVTFTKTFVGQTDFRIQFVMQAFQLLTMELASVTRTLSSSSWISAISAIF
jgi:hypothetical protein